MKPDLQRQGWKQRGVLAQPVAQKKSVDCRGTGGATGQAKVVATGWLGELNSVVENSSINLLDVWEQLLR
jgi:hypothetical protein